MSFLRSALLFRKKTYDHTTTGNYYTRCYDLPSRENSVDFFIPEGDAPSEFASLIGYDDSDDSEGETEFSDAVLFRIHKDDDTTSSTNSSHQTLNNTFGSSPPSGSAIRLWKTSPQRTYHPRNKRKPIADPKLPYANWADGSTGMNIRRKFNLESLPFHKLQLSPPNSPLTVPAIDVDTFKEEEKPLSDYEDFVLVEAGRSKAVMEVERSAEDINKRRKVRAVRNLSRSKRLDLSFGFPDTPLSLSVSPYPDWTQEFQDILKRPLLERGTQLHKLTEHFVSTAKNFGEIIIKERNLSIEEKSIKPLEGKGFAGGFKFKVANIFFKFAVDQKGLYPSDLYAMKVAGHELKGLTALVSIGMMLGLNFPLLALIDYKGFRLVATSVLPISDETLVYGSCDGGNTVKSDKPFLELFEKIARILNLKGHMAGLGNEKTFIYGPCDIEGHRAQDGKQYVVDTARVWPAEAPDARVKGSFLFRLLRPEFVSKYSKPLSSDVYSRFGETDSFTNNREASEATQYLYNTVITEFAKALEDSSNDIKINENNLVEMVHRAGINLRHMGRIRANLKTPELKRVFMLEMVARSLKNRLRSEMRKLSSSNDSQFTNLVLGFFGLIFASSTTPDTGSGTYIFWNTQLKLDVNNYFQFSLDSEERKRTYDLRTSIDMGMLFVKLQQLAGIKFAENVTVNDFVAPGSSCPSPPSGTRTLGSSSETNPTPTAASPKKEFVIEVKEKHMYAIARIEADTLAELARKKEKSKRRSDLKEAIEYYNLSLLKYKSVLELKPDDYLVLQNLGIVYVDLAKVLFHFKHSPEREITGKHYSGSRLKKKINKLFEQAYDNFSVATRLNKGSTEKVFNIWGNSLCDNSRILSRLKLHQLLEQEKRNVKNKTVMVVLHEKKKKALNEAIKIYNFAAEKYKLANEIQPTNSGVLFNWGNQLRNQSKIVIKLDKLTRRSQPSGAAFQWSSQPCQGPGLHVPEAEKLLINSTGKYRACTLLTKDTFLKLDSSINWGCSLMDLGKLKQNSNFLYQAKSQFQQAKKLLKEEVDENLRDSDRVRQYENLILLNMAAVEACMKLKGDQKQYRATQEEDEIDMYELGSFGERKEEEHWEEERIVQSYGDELFFGQLKEDVGAEESSNGKEEKMECD